MSTDKIAVFRVSPKMRELLVFLAEKDERSVNNMASFILNKGLKAHKFDNEECNKAVEKYFEEKDKEEPSQVLLEG